MPIGGVSIDWSRVPVVVGVGQLTNRELDPQAAPDPFALMESASRRAAAGVGDSHLRDLTHLWTVHSMSVRHPRPAEFLAGRLGAQDAETRCSGMGGSIPQWLVDRTCDLVVQGTRPRVLIAGVEALATRKRAKLDGVHLEWPSEPGWPDTWPPLEPDLGVHESERAHGLEQATAMYALVESALAHRAEENPDEHRLSMGDLMAGFNEVASQNPYSWFPTRRDADELTKVTDDNRMIYFPYPKYLNAVMDVDMAAALILTDAATAREWGLGPDEVIYVTGWADAYDVWYLSQRPAVDRSDALTLCGEVALDMAGIGVDDVSAFDLYSCFPSSIEVARDSLGIDRHDTRPLTLTGGLPYHGGPGSNYVTHSIANTFDSLRSGQSDNVLVHGNGYYLTKHAVGVYSSVAPSSTPQPPTGVQETADARVTEVPIDPAPNGKGSVLAYTALFTRDGEPERAVVVLDVSGRRCVARADDDLTASLLDADGVQTKVDVKADDEGNLARLASGG